jgi:hypothetical protein
MRNAVTPEMLQQQNQVFRDTGGVSANSCSKGFRSAFQDSATGRTYLSRYADGSPAPVHLLEGLPNELVLARDAAGRAINVKQTLVAGFVHAECFYTREQVALLLRSE